MSDLKHKTSKGMLWSGLMSLLQQVLGLVFLVVIARKLGPTDFGMVGMLTIFTAVATCLQDGGFVWALTNRKDVTHIQYSTIFWFNILLSVSIYLILFFSSPLIARYFGHEELIWLSRYVFLGIIFSSLGVIQTAYLFKQIRVKERALATVIGLIVSGVVGIILAYSGFSYWGIATQGLLNIGITTFALWVMSPFRPKFQVDWKFLKNIIPEGIRFVVPNIASLVSENIFSIILGKKYTVNDVGNFTQATKWNNASFSIILGMMRNVSQPVLVQVRDDKNQYLNVFRKLFRMAAFLVVPIMFGLAMVSNDLIEIVLTTKWLDSARILRILCIGGSITVLNSMASFFIMSLNRSKLYMYIGISLSILNIVSALFVSKWGIIALAYSYTVITTMSFIIYYVFIHQTHSYSLRMLLGDFTPIFIITIISILISYYSTTHIESIYIRFISRVLIAVTSYVISMQAIKCDSFLEVKALLANKIKKATTQFFCVI